MLKKKTARYIRKRRKERKEPLSRIFGHCEFGYINDGGNFGDFTRTEIIQVIKGAGYTSSIRSIALTYRNDPEILALCKKKNRYLRKLRSPVIKQKSAFPLIPKKINLQNCKNGIKILGKLSRHSAKKYQRSIVRRQPSRVAAAA